MSITSEQREEVRQRAGFACEYCGVTDSDTGGLLTVDHFHPQARGGTDALENLVYCCHRCNEYKADYWPESSDVLPLWNPRNEPAASHFLELADGNLYPVSPTGALTIRRLRLNRPPLVTHRLRRRQTQEEERQLTRLRDVVVLLEHLHTQHQALLAEQRTLLQEQRRLLSLLLGDSPQE